MRTFTMHKQKPLFRFKDSPLSGESVKREMMEALEAVHTENSEALPLTNCALLPVLWGDRTVMVDVSPLTVDEFRMRAIAMLEAHIAWGKMMFTKLAEIHLERN
jgi:hypothetical protein